MKKRNIFAIGCLTAMLGLGAFVGASSVKEVKPVEKAEATSTTRIFFDASYGTVDTGNAIFGAWLRKGDSSTYYFLKMLKVGDTGHLYSFDYKASGSYDKVTFFRLNPTYANNANYKDYNTNRPEGYIWGESPEQSLTGKNKYVVDNYTDKLYGYWSYEGSNLDSQCVYRVKINDDEWGDKVYAHIYGSQNQNNNTTWPGIDISDSYYWDNGTKVYCICTDVNDYTNIIINKNNYQLNTISFSAGTQTGAWENVWKSQTIKSMSVVNKTVYVYDYRDLFGGSPKCYAWCSTCMIHNKAYPGDDMDVVELSSGQLYSVSLDPMFDNFKIGINDDYTIGNQTMSGKEGKCYFYWNADDGGNGWGDLSVAKANDWINQTMRLRVKPHNPDDKTDSGACKGANGYYQKAKTAYQAYQNDEDITAALVDDTTGYANAKERFVAWAAANGEDVEFDGTNLIINESSRFVSAPTNESTPILTIVLVGFASVAMVGMFFILKKKKRNLI